MEKVKEILESVVNLKNIAFMIGSFCGAMAIIFYAFWQDATDRLGANNYDIHMPFGFLLLFIVAAIFIVAIVLTFSVLDHLDTIKETSYFSPITKTFILLILLFLILSIEPIGTFVYQMIRIFNPEVAP